MRVEITAPDGLDRFGLIFPDSVERPSPFAVLIENGMPLPTDKGICGKLKTSD